MKEGKARALLGVCVGICNIPQVRVCVCVCMCIMKRAAVSRFFQFKRAAAHLHEECRSGSLVGSPRGELERPRPLGDDKSLLPNDTATCVEADEEEEEEEGEGRTGEVEGGIRIIK